MVESEEDVDLLVLVAAVCLQAWLCRTVTLMASSGEPQLTCPMEKETLSNAAAALLLPQVGGFLEAVQLLLLRVIHRRDPWHRIQIGSK